MRNFKESHYYILINSPISIACVVVFERWLGFLYNSLNIILRKDIVIAIITLIDISNVAINKCSCVIVGAWSDLL